MGHTYVEKKPQVKVAILERRAKMYLAKVKVQAGGVATLPMLNLTRQGTIQN